MLSEISQTEEVKYRMISFVYGIIIKEFSFPLTSFSVYPLTLTEKYTFS